MSYFLSFILWCIIMYHTRFMIIYIMLHPVQTTQPTFLHISYQRLRDQHHIHLIILPNMHTKTTKSLNNHGHLGKIYQGLTKYIVIKYGRSLNLPKHTYRECTRSSIARTFFLIEREFESMWTQKRHPSSYNKRNQKFNGSPTQEEHTTFLCGG